MDSTEVRTAVRDGVTTRVLVTRRTYPTERTDLWSALTDPERVPRWFLPLSGDLVEGGRYAFEGNASGSVERCREPESFALTWESPGGDTSWLSVTLSEVAGGTELELVHEVVPDPDFWGTYGPGALGVGWAGALHGLGLYVATGEPVGAAAATFHETEEGRALYRGAADAWAAAAIADGDEPGAARAAADRTYGFFTGT
jgi:uncharacterized protein YndB with AHSA1/START domain